MPELPEVHRAANFIKTHAQGKTIIKVDANEDTIVFSGTTHEEFANAVRGRTVKDVGRYGKVFYLDLDGDGPMPVMHFGMTGNILIKGESPLTYKEGPKKSDTLWPPRFTKCILHLENPPPAPATQIAFIDPRRLGRIRLCKEPLLEPPISLLGFDPILRMPSLDDFSKSVLKRSCPVKALLLDQSFSAGVGNWVADEILYHSRVHPEQRCNTLSSDQVSVLYKNTSYVCQTAISVNADADKFPDNWLFNHRWGKGKKKHLNPLKLPSGELATIKWLKVGGRTSAFVTELQTANASKLGSDNRKEEADEESSLTSLSELDEISPKSRPKRARKAKRAATKPTGRKRQKTERV
ncbi:AtMMH-1 [Fomitiporia mediterranea MF3/22]|uniref:AtMMH-1 n=1 Tax=Fomitiporia mediterranea (strain MF3/22) TaxID=694068 RepID=UPI0004408F84|nr:AtMMH-1 [Fomitiporia mediterranea MF3/22]EJD04278.1 AtMMH-1 [Fomitiporia mediterranea MF3/22]